MKEFKKPRFEPVKSSDLSICQYWSSIYSDFSFHPYTILCLESVHDLSINLQYRSSLAHVRSYPNTVTIFLSRLNLAKSVNSAQTSMQSNPHIQAFQILANNWFTKCIKTCKSGIKTIKSFSDRWSRPLSSVVLSPLQP